jgi:hypothetical protein
VQGKKTQLRENDRGDLEWERLPSLVQSRGHEVSEYAMEVPIRTSIGTQLLILIVALPLIGNLLDIDLDAALESMVKLADTYGISRFHQKYFSMNWSRVHPNRPTADRIVVSISRPAL